ncbi:uncharacterized protein METZ01_LOCUS350480, partial [marine metagenome]
SHLISEHSSMYMQTTELTTIKYPTRFISHIEGEYW